MSANLQDVNSTGTPSGGAPSGDATSSGSASGEQALSSADVTTQPESVQGQGEGSGTVPAVPEYFKDIPSADELRQQSEQKVPYAAGLLNLRTALETLQPQYDQLQQRWTPWQPVIERYEKPEDLQSAFETGRGLFTETGELDPETQLPTRTAVPNLLKLGQSNPQDLFRLADDVMFGVGQQGRPMLYRGLEQIGLNPEHIEQYKTWEREGFSPQTSAGYSAEDIEAIAAIPKEYREAFDKAPPEQQRDWLEQSESLRNYNLKNAQYVVDDQKNREQAQQTAQVQFNQGIQTTSQAERVKEFGTSYSQLIEDLKPWQPTGDAATDGLYHHAVAQLLTNAFDSQMNADPTLPFSVIPILQQVAPELDVKALAAQADEWDKQRDLAVRYEAVNKRDGGRYQSEATQARNEANRTFRSLSTKMSALAKRVTEHLSGVKATEEAADLAAQNGENGSRPRVTGAPNGNQPPPNNGGYNTEWRKSFM